MRINMWPSEAMLKMLLPTDGHVLPYHLKIFFTHLQSGRVVACRMSVLKSSQVLEPDRSYLVWMRSISREEIHLLSGMAIHTERRVQLPQHSPSMVVNFLSVIVFQVVE